MADPFTRIGEWRLATDAGGWPRAVLGGTWDRPYLTVTADAETLHVAAIEVPIAVVRAVIERSAPVTALGEIERLAVEMAALTVKLVGRPEHDSDHSTAVITRRDLCFICDGLTAHARALADRDERIAALEAEVADKDTAMVLAQNAADRRGERIEALEAGLREAADLIAAVRDGYSDDPDDPCGGPPRYLLDAIVADEPRLRALADAPKK